MHVELDRSVQGSQLDAVQLSIVTRARQLRRKLRLARFIALGNVLGLGLFAGLSLLIGLLEWSLPLMALALAALAWNEERGRSLLGAADPAAPRRLAGNQLLLLAAVVVYCLWHAYLAWTGPTPLDAVLSMHPDLPEALSGAALQGGTSMDELSRWSRTAAVSLYSATAAGSALVQGLTAVYYLSLRPTLDALAELPAWARGAS